MRAFAGPPPPSPRPRQGGLCGRRTSRASESKGKASNIDSPETERVLLRAQCSFGVSAPSGVRITRVGFPFPAAVRRGVVDRHAHRANSWRIRLAREKSFRRHRSVHMEPSVSLSLDEITRRRSELPRERDLVLVCRTGARARLAAAELAGFRTRVLEGGIAAWREAGHPVVPHEPGAAGSHRGRRTGIHRRRTLIGAAESVTDAGGTCAASISPKTG